MKKIYIIIVLVVTIILSTGIWIYTHQANKLTITGLLDDTQQLKDLPTQYRHQFHAWGGDSDSEVTAIVKTIQESKSKVLLTVEPWPIKGDDELFSSILRGKYDIAINGVCRPLVQLDTPILRWGHEMETVGSRYPWATKDNLGYVAAFQYVHDKCKKFAPNIKFMWSPAGLENLDKYYPGDKYVDYVGLSVFGYPDYEKKTLNKIQNMDEILRPRYDRLIHIYKPVILAEFGCAGSLEYKNKWFDEGIQHLKSKILYPRIVGVVLFSSNNVDPWVDGISAPDFSLTADQAQTLLAKANTLERVK